MTYEQLQMNDLSNTESTPKKSPSYPQGSRVSLTVLQEKVEAIVTSVTCGERLQGRLEKLNQNGLSVKILPVYLQGKISDSSKEFSMTLPRWGIVSDGEYGALVTSAHPTEEIECFWSHIPTPLASDAIRMRYSAESLRKVGERRTKGEYKKAGCNLSEWVAVFPTPVASGKLNGGTGSHEKLKEMKERGQITEEERMSMSAGNGGKLNPTWVEWLMGFPLGWTDLDA